MENFFQIIFVKIMKTLINIKTDKDVKIMAKKTAEELGLSLSAIINAYLKQFIRNKSVFYSVVPTMSKELEYTLINIEKDIKQRKNLSPAISDAKTLKKHLFSL